MKSISQKTWELIHGLRANEIGIKGPLGFYIPRPGIFEALGESGETRAIPHFSKFLLHDSHEVRENTARAIGKLMTRLAPLEYAQFDEEARYEWACDYGSRSPWRNLSTVGLSQFWQLPYSISLLGLASSHNSGYVREAAVEELSKITDGSELPFLLVRLNDWTSVVRQKANAAIQSRLQPQYARHFFNNLPLVTRLKSCGRERHDEIVNRILAFLREPHSSSLLREGIVSLDRSIRRESFGILLESKSAERTDILKQVLMDEDPVLRLWAARNILRSLPDNELHQVLPALLKDRFMPVRCEALTIFAKRFPSEAAGKLRDSLLDTHPSMRSLARHILREQNAGIDYASFYRNAVASKFTIGLRSAILGLGETGKPDDSSLLFQFLTHPEMGVYKATIRALSALQGEKYVDHFLVALADPRPGVSNEGAKALKSHPTLVDPDFLWQLTQEISPFHVRKNAFVSILSLPFWKRGHFIILALAHRDTDIADMASRAFSSWLTQSGRISHPPTPTERANINAVIEQNKNHIAQHTLENLNFLLKTLS